MKKTNADKAWENQIETHPWINFPMITENAKYLILGSFPPNKFTSYRTKLKKGDSDFFYGSNRNKFWPLFSEANNIDYKNDINGLKSWLQNNRWIVSDIVLEAYRKADTANDLDLLVETWNKKIISDILNSNPIEKIYFTSGWVKNKFEREIKPDLKSEIISHIKTVLLISPSPYGLYSLDWARNILPQKIDETNAQYRLRYYRENFS